jgi:serine/threonine protein kinase
LRKNKERGGDVACKVRYLNSTGIMPREIKGVDALAKAFPASWLLYVSLNCYPRNQDPMEIDAVVVMDDQVLLLEIKDWNGQLTAKNDRWFVGRGSRGRSAVFAVEDKARKLKSVLRAENAWTGAFFVESRVVLTGTATKAALPPNQIDRVWSLQEACSLGDPARRNQLLPRRQIKLKKAYELEVEFDKVFQNTKLFQRSEADWAGFKITEKDIFVHPGQVWSDHFAERTDEPRIKAMVRLWSFDQLPVGLNSGETRKLVALRETHAFGYLNDLGSELIKRNRVLRDIISPEDPISTKHFEVRSIDSGWTTLDRYLVRRHDDLTWQDRVVVASALLSLISQLHSANVTHRDLGAKAVWIGSPSDLALTGFMSCQLPDKHSVMDWLNDLRGYAPWIPDDGSGLKSTGRQRDVYSGAYLTTMVLTGVQVKDAGIEAAVAALPVELSQLGDWLRRGLSTDPAKRFAAGDEMIEEFSAIVEDRRPDGFDASLLDRFETPTVPYQKWPLLSAGVTQGQKQIYHSKLDEQDVIVKVWMSVMRNRSLAVDFALHRLLNSAERLRGSPIKGLPRFLDLGLSPVGAFVTYGRCPGIPIADLLSLPYGSSLSLALDAMLAVSALHEMGCDHGDISPKNVLVDSDHTAIFLIDLFDMSTVGDASVRTPDMCPTNWERLGRDALDRYATLKIVGMLLDLDPSPLASAVAEKISLELQKPVIESLEVPISFLKEAILAETAPPSPEFLLRTFQDTHGFKVTDGLFVRRQTFDDGTQSFFLTCVSGQLVLHGEKNRLTSHRFRAAIFTSLAHESRAGFNDIAMKLTLTSGIEFGFEELYAYLISHERFSSAPIALLPVANHVAATFDIAWHWQKLVELEEDARVEIAISAILSQREDIFTCAYQNLGKDFDFDEDDAIEVYAGVKRIGYVDIGSSSLPVAIGLQCDRGRINVGDRVRLVGRRDQASMDRRSRAVRRILEGRSAIPALIDYLSPEGDSRPTTYSVKAEDDDLKAYELNTGQVKAFKHLLSSGPVGLLQGPPGTGKTRFIASFVHWLITKGGSQRVLIASQSHEAVNNAIDALLLLHKRRGSKPSLLRIGSKGITERIKPYHSAELRERYRVKFDAAAKFRFSQLTTALGVDRGYAAELFDLDRALGKLARRCVGVQTAFEDEAGQLVADRERNRVQLGRVQDAFKAAFKAFSGIEPDVLLALEEYQKLAAQLAAKHQISPADAAAADRALALTNDWLSSLGSPGRNFEEFLAKTRSVVAATCVGVGQTRIKIDSQVFDWVIVDEAARCTPGELAVPIQMARRVLLVGDHLQLRPMLDRDLLQDLRDVEPEVPPEQLSMSDFERAFTSPYGKQLGIGFTEQYRMDEAICNMVSRCFYEPHKTELVTSLDRVPALLPADISTHWLNTPMVWVDTRNHPKRSEAQLPNTTTFFNDAEVEAVIAVLDSIRLDSTLLTVLSKQEDETPIGVICTYSGQKRRLEDAWARHGCSSQFRRMVRIDTVDAYQGKENAIVILSLVRNNPDGLVGHVNISNRCNVALSRAKDRLIIVGDTAMWGTRVRANAPMRSVLEYMRKDLNHVNFLPMEDLT